ncbi:RNA polymerase subunit sigma [Variovorax sp. KBW07]|uniref:sigma-70 family RNA polymerase sigma factor n=1 Tax=Variovorax sp. KBW07 TaxID=2153358 RepID=UPI000F57ECFE|nr:sigma-70 family RNA polymerase sigma factor [Variovorax sp. KBW07]RQO48703.1 RNA polymerase subunit sigma [Variovorax sp. KBW07]
MSASHPAHEPLLHARELFAGHHAWLTNRLHARLGNMADAQDVASETFLRVIGQRDLAAVQEPRAFLTTIAKRLLFTLWRRRELERAYLDTLAQRPEEMAPSPEERAVLLETLEHIANALDGLSLKAHQAFLLSQLDGLGYHAIAAELGISHSTVRRHMADAFGRIALAMARQHAGIAAPARELAA